MLVDELRIPMKSILGFSAQTISLWFRVWKRREKPTSYPHEIQRNMTLNEHSILCPFRVGSRG
ncbi:MAG: hypothetical protein ACI97A_000005 [Planctomycetota bacterium]|jgi:hypothetical protein